MVVMGAMLSSVPLLPSVIGRKVEVLVLQNFMNDVALLLHLSLSLPPSLHSHINFQHLQAAHPPTYPHNKLNRRHRLNTMAPWP